MTTIEWTDQTWNPTTGCDRVSPGCDNCYALTMAKRLKAMGSEKYQRDGDPRTSGPGFGVSVHEDALTLPFSWRKPRKVFVNSMSDLFHAEVQDEFIAEVFSVMARTPQHTYQVLTKRHARMRSLLNRPSFRDNLAMWGQPWPLPNVWLGVSVENQHWADIRIPALLDTPAAVRFISAEPLLGPVDLHRYVGEPSGLSGDWTRLLDWVIAGGESGRGARPMNPYWPADIAEQCSAAGVPFLFKQHGAWCAWRRPSSPWADREPDAWVNREDGRVVTDESEIHDGWWSGVYRVGKKAAGRLLDGRTWDQYPEVPGA